MSILKRLFRQIAWLMNDILIYEVGPRDGLQNEKAIIPSAAKINLIDHLSECGFKKIEVTSFVRPDRIPQLSDAAEVFAGITRKPGVIYSALTPNLKGLEGALKAGAGEVAIFTSASETFSQRNINCSIDESLTRFNPVLKAASENNIPVRGYVSCVTDCPYEGIVHPAKIADVSDKLIKMGCYQISLGDTIGHGTPDSVSEMLDAVLKFVPAHKLAGHFHDTKGNAMENIKVCISKGISVFDTAIGGLGGCPYAPGASGNVSTEKVVEMLEGSGFQTGIDQTKLSNAAELAKNLWRDI